MVFPLVWDELGFAVVGTAPVDPTVAFAMVLLALGAVLGLFRWHGDRSFPRILGRGGLVLLLILLVALLAITWVFQAHWTDARLQLGILAGLIIISVWLAAFLFQEERKQRDREGQRRDTLTALQSEIYNIFSKIDNQAIKQTARKQKALMRNGATGPFTYVPFGTSEGPPILFDAVSGSIPVLRPDTIRPVRPFLCGIRGPAHHGRRHAQRGISSDLGPASRRYPQGTDTPPYRDIAVGYECVDCGQ